MKQFIVISGIDGCGKTTVIEKIRKKLEQQGYSTKYEWMRYNHRLVKPVHGLCRLIGLSRHYEIDGQHIWRHEFYRNRFFSTFYIILTWLDVWLGRLLLEIKLLLKNVDIVICDRWIQDVIIDLIVDTKRYDLLRGKWYKRFKRVLPAFTRQYIIARNTESIVTYRPDVMHDMSFKLRRKLYKRLMKNPDVVIVYNEKTVDSAADTIVNDWINNQACAAVNIAAPEHIKSKI